VVSYNMLLLPEAGEVWWISLGYFVPWG